VNPFGKVANEGNGGTSTSDEKYTGERIASCSIFPTALLTMTNSYSEVPKLFSFFSGAGFLDLGFEDEGFPVVHVNEFHGPFLKAYRHSRQILGTEPPEYGYSPDSITDFLADPMLGRLRDYCSDASRNGSLTGFIGGPPCPDFSVGGKNRGRYGERGQLSKIYCDLICELRPDFFLFENVKGLWSTKRHREFYDELKMSFRLAGYRLTDRLINCIEYGAPQDRERVVLLGFHDSIFVDQGVSTGHKNFPWLRFAQYPRSTAFQFPWPKTAPFIPNSQMECPVGVPKELTVESWFERNAVEEHPNSGHCFKPRAGIVRFESVEEGDDSRKCFKRLHRWRYSPTACYGNNEVHLHPYRARRISVAEALALQSLPSRYALPSDMTLSDMFKTVGNGVPYLAARKLAQSIKSFLEAPHEIDSVEHRELNSEAAIQQSLQLY
jgi:DNA (cytosine-5)-methyltransferase 1